MKYYCHILLFWVIVFPVNAEINNQTLAVLVNKNDPESLEIAKFYQQARQIPDKNIIYLNFKPGVNALSEAEFNKITTQLKQQVPNAIQAYALAWRKPWRVACMSITSAFSLGFDKGYCAEECKVTKATEYFNSNSKQPFSDFNLRPSMMLSGESVESVKLLINRGVSADFTRPKGTAYLLSTSDKARNVRARVFPVIEKTLAGLLDIDVIQADAIKNRSDVMFYFTGLKKVRWLQTNQFAPGAIADHLTSSGGVLFNSGQMSALKWIEAGATATYGAVVEPCSFTQKFPAPGIVMQRYLAGETLIEAYWKSVQMPGQGVFVGEPLASPYKNCRLVKNKQGRLFYARQKIENQVERKWRNCH